MSSDNLVKVTAIGIRVTVVTSVTVSVTVVVTSVTVVSTVVVSGIGVSFGFGVG